MFETVAEAYRRVTAPGSGDDLDDEALVARIAALEELSQAAQALQARRLAALKALRVAEDAQIGLCGDMAGRSVPVEVSKALGVATMTARTRVENAATAVESHPRLLELVGTGRVSMAGLNRVIETTRVLEPAQQRRVDELVCAEARRRKMTPGELAKAADRRTLRSTRTLRRNVPPVPGPPGMCGCPTRGRAPRPCGPACGPRKHWRSTPASTAPAAACAPPATPAR